MTDNDYIGATAIRAEESAKQAHHRLDRMNGSIDRLTNQVAAGNAAIASVKGELSAKLDGILLQLAHSTGFEQGEQTANKRFLDSRRFVVTTIVALLVGLVGAVATLVWLAISG